jgi:hypothetical protein
VRWRKRRLPVAAVLAAWVEPNGKAFRVLTENGKVFDLLYDQSLDDWELHEVG